MPRWYIRILNDAGNEEWMIVHAQNAADAMERVGVHVSRVRVLKAHGKVQGSVLRSLASAGLTVYFLAVIGDSLGWNGKELAALGAALVLTCLGTWACLAILARRRSRAGSEPPIKRRQVSKNSRSIRDAAKWILLMVAVILGVFVVAALGGEEAIKPGDVVLPFFLFCIVWMDPADLW